eukprot:TRINITY_DN2079_c0_g2_i1.p1 TRINITY_DN2079_c0_g2~~TRINITY_DN2079_c0_g2_i1.p1  ORF type:complete len:296 (-),score=58.49 TRINITY_DN2079_c0_g2_i1:304-1122(-)
MDKIREEIDKKPDMCKFSITLPKELQRDRIPIIKNKLAPQVELTGSGKQWSVFALPAAHVTVANLLQAECTIRNDYRIEWPREWQCTNPESVPAGTLEDVPRGSTEWNDVAERHDRNCRYRIQNIQRIVHAQYYKKYFLEKQEMMKRLGRTEDQITRLLYHGTGHGGISARDVSRCPEGIDFRYSNRSCAYGPGAYFAVNASYSEGSYMDSNRQIMECEVLVGNPHPGGQVNSRLRVVVTAPAGYDSVQGGSDMFVLYHHYRAYFKYLITVR